MGEKKKEKGCTDSLDKIKGNPKINWNIRIMSLKCFRTHLGLL